MQETNRGNIFNIQRFCVHDGPGIRTTVFFQGCGLRCAWCHNPEGLTPEGRVRYLQDECLGCGACAAACPQNAHEIQGGIHTLRSDRCIGCGRCVQVCNAGALLPPAVSMTVEEVMSVVLQDRAFYGENGGLTCSGGECLRQSGFVAALLARARAEGLSTAVDTAGHVPWRAFLQVLPVTDLFLYDLKCMDAAVHERWTGQPNTQILENLRRLADTDAHYRIRIPLIPHVNAYVEEMEAMAAFLSTLRPPEQIDLIPYHTVGREKYGQLGITPPYTRPADEPLSLDDLSAPFSNRGFIVQ